MDTLKVGTAWIEIEVTSEVDVVMTFKGYAPVLQVRLIQSGLVKQLYISARSISVPLERFRETNSNRFQGLRLRLRKDGEEATAKYIVEAL